MNKSKTIFISCGQYTEAEKLLGKRISDLVRTLTDFVPFFAEEVQDLNGLDANILNALHDCAGFITVIHPRGEITRPNGPLVRASVWIEQEIAIATYIQQIEKRALPIIAFKHKSVGREGIRDLLHLNPFEFSEESEVLIELPKRLAEWKSLKPVTRVPAATPKPHANLRVEATKLGQISLENDVWTLRQTFGSRSTPKPALLTDISNVPTSETHAEKVAIRAAIRMDYGGRERTYSPLPWLEELTNVVYLDTGGRKTVVLAVGEDSQTGIWNFVLNHRSDYATRGDASAMDRTNACPILSDLPFEILMIGINSGAVFAKFTYVWTFDALNNWPILKTVD